MLNRICSFAVSLLLAGLAGCGGAAPPPIEIGHVSDSKRLDEAGKQAERGLRLALHELSKDDALAEAFGGKKIQIRHTDAQGKLEAFESQAVRLEAVSRCTAIFGGLAPAETNGLGSAKTPILTFHGQPTPGAGSNVFYLGMTPSRQGASLAKVVAEDAGAIRVVLLVDDRRAESLALAESFQKTLSESRKDAKPEPMRFSKDAKWSDFVERISAQETHVVVFAGSVQDFNAWHKVLRKEFFGEPPLIVYGGGDGDQRVFDFEGNDKVSVVLATAFHADPASERIATFLKAFREANQVEADVHAALAHDGLRLLVDAMKQTSTQLTPEKLGEELLKTSKFEGLTGPITINAERLVERPLHVLRWQNGTMKLVKTIAP